MNTKIKNKIRRCKKQELSLYIQPFIALVMIWVFVSTINSVLS